MAELLVNDIYWKKGEQGLQNFEIFDSDNVTPRDGTGKTYTFKFWKQGEAATKGSGSLVDTDITNGKWQYTVQSTDTDTVENYIGELIEDPAGAALRSNTFYVIVEDSSP